MKLIEWFFVDNKLMIIIIINEIVNMLIIIVIDLTLKIYFDELGIIFKINFHIIFD